jgi:hypothetical protein
VRGTFAGFPTERSVAFPVTQICEDGSTAAWDELVPAGADPHSVEHPAPMVTVRAAGTAEHGGHDMAGMAPAPSTPAKVAASAGSEATGAATAGSIELSGGFARAMLPGQKVGGGYITIANTGDRPDRLLSVSSPMAGGGSVHEMTMKGDVMTMRELKEGIEIPAGGTIALAPGSTHLMFTEVAEPFAQGGVVPVTLTFERAGTVELSLPIAAPGAKAP